MPITWKNVAAPSFTGAAASLAGASDSFKNAGEALTAAFKGPLEDRRKAAEDARLEAAGMRQQEAHALAQQLGQYEVDTAAFDVDKQAEMFGLNKASKMADISARNRQFTGASSSKTKPSKEQFLQMQRQTTQYKVAAGLYEKHEGDRELIQQEGMSMGIDPNTLGLATSDLEQVKLGTEAMQKARLTANKTKSGSNKSMQPPKELYPDAWDFDTKTSIKVEWRKKEQNLRDAGFSNSQIATIMNKGYGHWGGWDEARSGLIDAQKNTSPAKN